jgi:hypothetical protein
MQYVIDHAIQVIGFFYILIRNIQGIKFHLVYGGANFYIDSPRFQTKSLAYFFL